MSCQDLWKYCTGRELTEAICALGLLEGTTIAKEKQLSCIHAVSNHAEKHYRKAKLPKRNGGVRTLFIPDYLLWNIQKNILKKLLNERAVSTYAKAYFPGASLKENANVHVGADVILKMDIKDFFENITYLMVYQQAFPEIYYPSAIRTLLAHLCCYKDMLPQGAVTSPAISNLVMLPFDNYIGTWCKERKLRYTRYCDDLTFSGTFDAKEVKQKVRSCLQAFGFEVNPGKTRVQTKQQRQSVTGIVVNEKLQVSKDYRRRLRQEVYLCEKYREVQQLQRLIGKVSYVLQINPDDAYFQNAYRRLQAMWKQ